jgi:hypothetical protein
VNGGEGRRKINPGCAPGRYLGLVRLAKASLFNQRMSKAALTNRTAKDSQMYCHGMVRLGCGLTGGGEEVVLFATACSVV